jgi:hypothetical protein
MGTFISIAMAKGRSMITSHLTRICIRIICSLSLLTLVAACGGGGGGGSISGTPPTTADDTCLIGYVDQTRGLSESEKDYFREFKYTFKDLPDAIVYANGTNPIEADSEYLSFASPTNPKLPPAGAYPNPNGELFFDSSVCDVGFALRTVDLTNGAVSDGAAKVYWGVKQGEYRSSDGALLIHAVFMTDEIVTENGKALYRGLRIVEGWFCPVAAPCDIGNGTILQANFPGEYFVGRYTLILEEILDAEGAAAGGYQGGDRLLEYDAILQRQDAPGNGT